MQKTPFNEFKSVEATKAASSTVQRLFPDLTLPVQGELQTITRLVWESGGKDQSLIKAGQWWLWFRNIFIENTMPRDSKRKIMIFACQAAATDEPITIVTTRSPELLHAQVGMADLSLPRSRKSLLHFKQIIDASARWVPTKAKVILADLAIDNLAQISRICNTEDAIQKNLIAIKQIAEEIHLDCSIHRLSDLSNSLGMLKDLIHPDGSPKFSSSIPVKAWPHIKRVMNESIESHRTRLGWTQDQSKQHNFHLAVTMGMVGMALNQIDRHILIHNEAFISRGALNNIFNPPHNPLPVICLADLLESKAAKG